VDWIFTHFSGCGAPSTERSTAANCVHACLIFNVVLAKATNALSRWRSDATKRQENGQLGQCLDDGMQLGAIARSNARWNTSLVEQLLREDASWTMQLAVLGST
jgi:hypothetical protein